MIEQNTQNQVGQPVLEQTPMVVQGKRLNIGLLIAISLIVISLIAGGVYAGMQLGKKQNPPVIPSQTESPTSVVIPPTNIPDTTADWKTYTNSLLSYSVKYPQNWLLLDLAEGKQIEIYYQPDKTKSVGEILIEEIDSSSYNRELDSNQATKNALIGDTNAKCKTDNVEKTWCYLISNNKYLSILIVKEKDQEYNKILDQILSTLKFLSSNSTTQPVESDGKQIGFIKKVYPQSGQQYIDIDYVEWLTGTIGEKACVEDKKCVADCVQIHCLSDGYYIRNNNSKIRTLEIAQNSTFEILDISDLSKNKTIDFSAFQKYIIEKITKNGEDSNLFRITISSGKVVNISEQYRP